MSTELMIIYQCNDFDIIICRNCFIIKNSKLNDKDAKKYPNNEIPSNHWNNNPNPVI